MVSPKNRIRKNSAAITTTLVSFSLAYFDVHEEEDDQSGFDGGDDECDCGIEWSEIQGRGVDGETGADEKRDAKTRSSFQAVTIWNGQT